MTRRGEDNNVRWDPPTDGCLKINVDGSVLFDGAASCGGVVRDSHGRWISGFVNNLRINTITNVELMSIWGAIMVANQLIPNVTIESDSLAAVRMISSLTNPMHSQANLVRRIQDAIHDGPFNLFICHTLREPNFVADKLACLAHSFPLGFHHIISPPESCIPLLRNDVMGVHLPRPTCA